MKTEWAHRTGWPNFVRETLSSCSKLIARREWRGMTSRLCRHSSALGITIASLCANAKGFPCSCSQVMTPEPTFSAFHQLIFNLCTFRLRAACQVARRRRGDRGIFTGFRAIPEDAKRCVLRLREPCAGVLLEARIPVARQRCYRYCGCLSFIDGPRAGCGIRQQNVRGKSQFNPRRLQHCLRSCTRAACFDATSHPEAGHFIPRFGERGHSPSCRDRSRHRGAARSHACHGSKRHVHRVASSVGGPRADEVLVLATGCSCGLHIRYMAVMRIAYPISNVGCR